MVSEGSPDAPIARESRALSDRLQEIKAEKGLSYRQIARDAGLTSGQVSNLLNGRMENPPLSVLLGLRRGLRVGSIDELLGPMPSETYGQRSLAPAKAESAS